MVGMVGFFDDLAAAKAAEREHDDVDVVLNGQLHVLRFTQMSGTEWAQEVVKHPAREGVVWDTSFGYNLHSVVRGVSPLSGSVLVDGEPEALDREHWADLLDALDGNAVQRIGDAIFGLNAWRPAKAVEAAKKALARSRKTSS